MKRDIIIDADHIVFLVCEARMYKDDDELDGETLSKIPFKQYTKHFRAIVEDYILTAEVESICYNWKLGKVRVIMSDKTNFRYKVYPEYKAKRPPSSKLRKKLRKWAMKEFHFEPNTEADDVVAYYVRKGGLGFTTDKDLLKGVKGRWFNCHYMHRTWGNTTKEEAEHFFKCQVLAGDAVDGIPSIKGVGIKTAMKFLKDHGSDWESIEKIFLNKGYDRDYMITMARLVSMSQWSPKKGVKLWKIPKK